MDGWSEMYRVARRLRSACNSAIFALIASLIALDTAAWLPFGWSCARRRRKLWRFRSTFWTTGESGVNVVSSKIRSTSREAICWVIVCTVPVWDEEEGVWLGCCAKTTASVVRKEPITVTSKKNISGLRFTRVYLHAVRLNSFIDVSVQ